MDSQGQDSQMDSQGQMESSYRATTALNTPRHTADTALTYNHARCSPSLSLHRGWTAAVCSGYCAAAVGCRRVRVKRLGSSSLSERRSLQPARLNSRPARCERVNSSPAGPQLLRPAPGGRGTPDMSGSSSSGRLQGGRGGAGHAERLRERVLLE